MYVKNIIKLLAESGEQSIYSIAKALKASEGSIYPCIVKLRKLNVISQDNQLTHFGWQLYRGLQAFEGKGVNKGEFLRRFGSDVAKALKHLRIIEERPELYVERKLLDPPLCENEDVTIIDEVDLPTGLAVKGVICPKDHFIPVQEPGWPVLLVCPECGEELKHTGHGMYVPRRMVRESPLEFSPRVISFLGPLLFGVVCIMASALSQENQQYTCPVEARTFQ